MSFRQTQTNLPGIPKGSSSLSPRAQTVLYVLGLTFLALVLRTLQLGNIFQSSDNCELATRILQNPGYLWMAKEPYGVLINLIAKLFVGTLSTLGVTITEFWWKLPVALVGVLHVPLTYLFLRDVGVSQQGARHGAEFIVVVPVHVGQSRYLWGYEILGVFFLTLALGGLIRFLRDPSKRNSVFASAAIALYLISHGFIVPFLPCFFLTLLMFGPGENEAWRKRVGRALGLLGRRLVWVGPLIVSPLCYYPLRHTLLKPVRPGFYLLDHLDGFVTNTGLVLALLTITAVFLALVDRYARSTKTIFFALAGGCYLAPLFFGAPPGITVAPGYMLVGTCLWLYCLASVLDRIARWRPTLVSRLAGVCVLITLWSTVETIFGRDAIFDPNGVRIERGEVPADIGTKAAGYLIRKYAAPDVKLLCLHRAIEPPNLEYYFGVDPKDRNKKAFYDLPLQTPPGWRARKGRSGSTEEAFRKFGSGADIVICEERQLPYVTASDRFEKVIIIHSEGQPRMFVFSVPGTGLPEAPYVDTADLNRAYDREYAPKVGLW